MCLSAFHAARANTHLNNPEKPGNQFRQGIMLSSVKVLRKPEEMGSEGSDPLSALQWGLVPNSGMEDLRDCIPSCLRFVELVPFLGSSMVQGVGKRAGTKSSL